MPSVRYQGRTTATQPRVFVGRGVYVSLNGAALEAIGYPKYMTVDYFKKYGARLVFSPTAKLGRGHLKIAYTASGTTGRVYFQGVQDAFGLKLELGSNLVIKKDQTLTWKLTDLTD
jgi:hypothetical protein